MRGGAVEQSGGFWCVASALIHPSIIASHFTRRDHTAISNAYLTSTTLLKKGQFRNSFKLGPLRGGERNQPGVGDVAKWWVLVRHERLDSSIHRSSFSASPAHFPPDRTSALKPQPRHLKGQVRKC